jgi:proton-translocating NADH-quinone oxidoreductase chain L
MSAFLSSQFLGVSGVLFSIGSFLCIACSMCFFALFNLYEAKQFLFIIVQCQDLQVSFSFTYNVLTFLMCFVVITVAFCTILFAFDYMYADPFFIKFIGTLSIFTFFMLFLILSGNFITFFFGWEGIGICSYLLISFWKTRVRALKSALLAVITNKVSDLFLLIGLLMVFISCNSFSFVLLQLDVQMLGMLGEATRLYTLGNFFFLLAAVGKSAQLGLHIWLPEAMEGPTPVSSLIHAATMVTAGIFLFLKLGIVLHNNLTVLWLILLFGSCTTVLGGSLALFQTDFKKIVAYSTCSQLGYMFLCCGLLGYQYTFYHLVVHAFFKALIFLSSGYLIHNFCGEQDLRTIGGIVTLYPFAFIAILGATLSMMGIPGFSGYFSKEQIIEEFLLYSFTTWNYEVEVLLLFLKTLSLFCISLTFFYSIRYFIFLFSKTLSIKQIVTHNVLKSLTFFVLFSLMFLQIMCYFSGMLLYAKVINTLDVSFISPSHQFFNSTLSQFSARESSISSSLPTRRDQAAIMHSTFAMLALVLVSLTYLLSRVIFFTSTFSTILYSIRNITQQRFFIFTVIEQDCYYVYNLGYAIYTIIDKTFLEFDLYIEIANKSLYQFQGSYLSLEFNRISSFFVLLSSFWLVFILALSIFNISLV